MRIACDRCGNPFEAADDQELCAACRDAAAIGDPYKATPAVLGDGEPPDREDGKTIAGLEPPVAVDHAALFHAALRLCRQRPALLLAHGVVSYGAMIPFADVLGGFASLVGASRADLSLTALVALLTLGLACAVQAISFAVTVVRLERSRRDPGAHRPILDDVVFVFSRRRREIIFSCLRRLAVNALLLCLSLSGLLWGNRASGVYLCSFVCWSALVNDGPKATNHVLNGVAAIPLPKAISLTQQPVDRKNAAAVIGLVLGILLLFASAVSLEVFAARISPVVGWAALGLLASPFFGISVARAYATYVELRRRAVD